MTSHATQSSIQMSGPGVLGRAASVKGFSKILTAAEIRVAASVYSASQIDSLLTGYQSTLVSGTNIKTVNGASLLGSGNVSVSASPGGSSGQIQWNNAGAFDGAAAVVYAASGTHVVVTGQSSTAIPLCVKGAASHSTNLLEGQTSAGANVFFVRNDGRVVTRNGLAVANSGGTEVGRFTIFGSDLYIDNVAVSGTSIFRTNAGNKTPLTLGAGGDISATFQHGIRIGSLSDGTAATNSVYYSTTQNKLCYKDSGGTVNVLY
jgi:hypothetical protein